MVCVIEARAKLNNYCIKLNVSHVEQFTWCESTTLISIKILVLQAFITKSLCSGWNDVKVYWNATDSIASQPWQTAFVSFIVSPLSIINGIQQRSPFIRFTSEWIIVRWMIKRINMLGHGAFFHLSTRSMFYFHSFFFFSSRESLNWYYQAIKRDIYSSFHGIMIEFVKIQSESVAFLSLYHQSVGAVRSWLWLLLLLLFYIWTRFTHP